MTLMNRKNKIGNNYHKMIVQCICTRGLKKLFEKIISKRNPLGWMLHIIKALSYRNWKFQKTKNDWTDMPLTILKHFPSLGVSNYVWTIFKESYGQFLWNKCILEGFPILYHSFK